MEHIISSSKPRYQDPYVSEIGYWNLPSDLSKVETTKIASLIEWWSRFFNYGARTHHPTQPGQILAKLKQARDELLALESAKVKQELRAARSSARVGAKKDKEQKKRKQQQRQQNFPSENDQLGACDSGETGGKRIRVDSGKDEVIGSKAKKKAGDVISASITNIAPSPLQNDGPGADIGVVAKELRSVSSLLGRLLV